MTQAGPLTWQTGAGWLVLVGGGKWDQGETEEVDAAVLMRANFSQPVAFLPTASGSLTYGEALLDYYVELGGPHGYVVPIFDAAGANDPQNRRLLAEAGLIYLGGGETERLVQALRGSPALEGMAEAFATGAIIVGMSAGAVALGAWGLPEEGEPFPCWGWVHNGIVEPHFAGADSAPRLRALLAAHPGMLGLGIPEGCALALGPEGQVDTWGAGRITVVLAEPAGDVAQAV